MPSATDLNRRLRLVFISPCVGEDFFRPVKQGMKDAAAMLGVDCAFEGTADVDLDEQAAIMRRALARGCDGIALSIIHPTAFQGVIDEALARGVPVVAFNVDASHGASGCLSAICQDFVHAGRVLGREALPHIPAGCGVLFTVHSDGISALEERLEGAQEVLRSRGIPWERVTTGIDSGRAAEVIAAALRANASLGAVLCSGLADLQGAGLALAQDEFAGRYFAAGFDVSPEVLAGLAAGRLALAIDQQPYVQGFYPVVQLTHYLRYGLRPANIDAGATVIRQGDVDRVMQASVAGYR